MTENQRKVMAEISDELVWKARLREEPDSGMRMQMIVDRLRADHRRTMEAFQLPTDFGLDCLQEQGA